MLQAKTVQRHVVVEFVAIREGISGPLFRQMLSCALEQHIPKVAVFRESPASYKLLAPFVCSLSLFFGKL